MNDLRSSKLKRAKSPTEVPSVVVKALVAALLTRKQVADRLQTCVHTVARYTRSGLLPCVMINRRVIRYRPEDVDAFIANGLTSPPHNPAMACQIAAKAGHIAAGAK